MKVPKDPNFYLTVFAGIWVCIILVFWGFTPVYTPHLEEDSEHAGASLKPEQALGQVDAMLAAAEKTFAEMDAEKNGEKAELTSETTKPLPAKEGSKSAKVEPALVPDAPPAEHDMAGQDHGPEGSSHSPEAGGDHGH